MVLADSETRTKHEMADDKDSPLDLSRFNQFGQLLILRGLIFLIIRHKGNHIQIRSKKNLTSKNWCGKGSMFFLIPQAGY
jgi:hypothetical protein